MVIRWFGSLSMAAAVGVVLTVLPLQPPTSAGAEPASPAAVAAQSAGELVGSASRAAWNGSDPAHVFAFSNYSSVPNTAQDTYDAAVPKCPKRVVALPKLTLATATKRVNAWLRRTPALARATTAFVASPQARTSAAAQALTVSAVLYRQSEAAVAAGMRWAALDGRNPAALTSAAALLARAGLLPEAAAVNDAAAALRPSTTTGPFGIDVASQVANNRGYILLMSGQYAAAEKVLTPLRTRAPLLAEARTNLSAVQICGKKLRVINAGRTRVIPPPGQTGLPADPMDTSGGVPAAIPAPTVPTSPFNYPFQEMDARLDAAAAKADYYSQQKLDGWQHATAPTAYNEATASRQWYFQGLLANGGPRWKDYVAEPVRRLAALREEWAQRQGEGVGTDTCSWPDLLAMEMFPRWREAEMAFLAANTAYEDARYKYASGLLSNATQRWAAPQLALEKELMWVRYRDEIYPGTAVELPDGIYLIWGLGNNPFAIFDPCTGAPAEAGTPQQPPTAQERFCAALSAVKFTLDVGMGKVKVSCEEVSVELRWPPTPPVQAFAKASLNVAQGSATVFVGSRVGGSFGPIRGDVRAGAYVTVSGGGTVDFGARDEAKASVGWDGVEVDVASGSPSQVIADAFPL